MSGWIPWFAIGCNVIGVILMLRFGLPPGFPLVGRGDGDVMGLVGLALFALSIAIRISTIVFFGT